MTEYSFSLETFSDDLLSAYESFPEVQHQTPAQIRWKLRDGPFGPGSAMVARDGDGSIVGMNAFQKARLVHRSGRSIDGDQSMDTVVAEAARGRGLFTRMYRAYYESTASCFVYGFPNKNSAPAFFNKLGWSRFGAVPMRIKPLRTGFLTRRLGLGAVDFRVPSFRRAQETSAEFETFTAAHEAAWRTILSATNCWGVDRSAHYLNWRYRDHPGAEYRKIERLDGTFAVFTILDKHEARILYVMEALGRPGTLLDLLQEVSAIGRAEGAELALGWGAAQPPLSSLFLKCGFLPFPERLRTNEIHFGARLLGTHDGPGNGSDWLISYSDSDTV